MPKNYVELDLSKQTKKEKSSNLKTKGSVGKLGLEQSTQRQILFKPLGNTERIIGTDDRKRIYTTEEYPFRMICKLSMSFHGQPTYAGSGALISKNMILTAAHNVYDHGMGAAHTITAAPGQADFGITPHGEFTVKKVFFPEAFKTDQGTHNDYACLLLDEDIGDEVGYFGIMGPSDNLLRNSILQLTGYPGDKGGMQLWHHYSTPMDSSETVIKYTADTFGGNSGGPIYTYEDGQDDGYPTIFGIHTFGSKGYKSETQFIPEHNGGRRIDREVMEAVASWMAAAKK